MKIVIDARCLIEGRRTGVEEYTLNLLRAIFEIDKDNDYVLFFNSWKDPRVDLSWLENFPNVQVRRFRWPNKLLNLFFWYFGWPHLDEMCGGADVVFLPNIIFFATSKRTRLVTTIHDLSFERYPQYFSLKRKLWHMFINPKKICLCSDSIIAVSSSTKCDVAEIYGIEPAKIQVIYSGTGDKYRPIDRNDPRLLEIKAKYDLPYKFIFFLGTIEPRKNITSIVRAFGVLKDMEKREKNHDIGRYKLVLAGEKGWSAEKIYQEIHNSPYKDDIRIISPIADEDKEYLYNLASLFVYPSYFEGFGFPPIEAMRCGVPVICSNNSSLPEVVGESAILIDPDKTDDLYRAMSAVLTSRKLRELLISNSIAYDNKYDWKDAARKTLMIFR